MIVQMDIMKIITVQFVKPVHMTASSVALEAPVLHAMLLFITGSKVAQDVFQPKDTMTQEMWLLQNVMIPAKLAMEIVHFAFLVVLKGF